MAFGFRKVGSYTQPSSATGGSGYYGITTRDAPNDVPQGSTPYYLARPGTDSRLIDPNTTPIANYTRSAYATDPGLAYYQGLQGLMQTRAAGADAYLNEQTNFLNRNYAIDLAKQGLRLQGIDIDRAANTRDLDHLGIQETIARQRHGLGIRGTNFDEADINRQAAGDMRRLNSDATARMAFTAPGVNEGRQDITSAQQSAIDRLNTVTREGIHLDLNERLVGLWHQRDQVKDTGAKLDLAAKAVGLDRDSLKLQLEQGLAKLNFDRVMNADQLIEGLFSTDAGIRQRSLDIANQIMTQGLAGQLPYTPAGPTSGASPGGVVPGNLPIAGGSFTNDWGNPRSGGRTHQGTDIFGPMGAPVGAFVGGTVIVAGSDGGKGGNRVWIKGDDGRYYYYAHLQSIGVRVGDRVGAGGVIGANGNSGNASGGAPHVHFGISTNGPSGNIDWVNPYPFLVARR